MCKSSATFIGTYKWRNQMLFYFGQGDFNLFYVILFATSNPVLSGEEKERKERQ